MLLTYCVLGTLYRKSLIHIHILYLIHIHTLYLIHIHIYTYKYIYLQQIYVAHVFIVPIPQMRKLELRNLTKVTKLMDASRVFEIRSTWFPKPSILNSFQINSHVPSGLLILSSVPINHSILGSGSKIMCPCLYLLNGYCEDKNEPIIGACHKHGP